LYMTNKIKHVLAVSVPLPGGFGTLTGQLFVGLPMIRFRERGDDTISIDVHMWGTVTAPLAMTVELTATVVVPPALQVATVDRKPQLQLGLNGAAATVSNAVLVTNPPLPQAVASQLTPAQLAAQLQSIVRSQLSGQSPAPIGLTALGGLRRAVMTPTGRVIDGVMLIGIDVAWPGVTDPMFIDSRGDPAELEDIRRGGDVAMFVAADHVPAAFSDVLAEIKSAVAAEGAVLDGTPSLTSQPGAIRVQGSAHNDQGTATFGFDVRPILTVDSRDDRNERIRFETANIDVSINPTLANKVGAAFLGLLTLGWIGIYANDMANAMRARITFNISESNRDVGARTTWFTLPDTTSPPIKLRVQEYRITGQGTFVQISITPLFPKPRILGVSRLWADGDGHVQTYNSFDFPPDVLADDPQLLVAWTLTRTDTSEVIGQGGDQEFRADITLPSADPVPEVELSCTVKRRLATTTRTLFHISQKLFDRRLIDRRHPYVRWVRKSVVPWVQKEADRSLTPLGLRTIDRRSALHRTDVPNSCLFIEPQGGHSGSVDYTYLDALPFRESELVDNRQAVCDYCFFGGPDKTEPLPLPS
jgi:hypothetical protein